MIANCTNCGKAVTAIDYELSSPLSFKGGSNSFVAVAFPCNHIVGVVPASWGHLLDQISAEIKDIKKDLKDLEYELQRIGSKLR